MKNIMVNIRDIAKYNWRELGWLVYLWFIYASKCTQLFYDPFFTSRKQEEQVPMKHTRPTENSYETSKKWVRGSWAILSQLGSFREQRHHHMTSSHPSNVCTLYKKWGITQNLVANRPPGELEHCSGSLSSSGNLLFSCLISPWPLCSHSPIAHAYLLLCKTLSALVFLLHVNVSICLVSWFPRKDLSRRVWPPYASPG